MNTTNTYGLIQIGLLIRWLVNIDVRDDAQFILDQLDELEKHLDDSNFQVSLYAMQNLNNFLEAKGKLKELKKDEKISNELEKLISDTMISFETIVVSESGVKKIYIIPQRRYNGEYLISSPEKLLKENIFGILSDIAKFDFAASCRCISFGEATAAAFHILRATEDTLKQYYFCYKKTKRLQTPMWGPMTNELRNKRAPKPSQDILSALDLVRTSYRNPTQHPLAKYDIESAQDLLGVCVDLINKMGSKLI